MKKVDLSKVSIQNALPPNKKRKRVDYNYTETNRKKFKTDHKGRIVRSKQSTSKNTYELRQESKLEPLKEKANQGDVESMLELGNQFLSGKEVPLDYKKAISWFKKAAKKGNPHAEYKIGMCYREGHGVSKSEKTSISWLTKAAKKGHHDAIVELIRHYASDPDKGDKTLEWVLHGVKHGSTVAMTYLSVLYENGECGLQKDSAEAFKWCKAAADNGNSDAINDVGWHYLKGRGVEQNYELAMKYFLKAAEKNSANACYNIAEMYWDGLGVKEDAHEAFKWYEKASNLGHEVAYRAVATMLCEGVGCELDIRRGLTMLFSAAMKNDTISMLLLGKFCENRKRYKDAVFWYAMGADHEDVDCMFNLGLMYQSGLGVHADDEEAAVLFLEAAKKGHAPSQCALGMLCDDEKSQFYNRSAAFNFFYAAAKKGNIVACHELACMYLDLYATFKNEKYRKDSIEYFVKAAESGFHKSAYGLGILHFEFTNPPNLKDAKLWFRKALYHIPIAQYKLGLLLNMENKKIRSHLHITLAATRGCKDAKAYLGSNYLQPVDLYVEYSISLWEHVEENKLDDVLFIW